MTGTAHALGDAGETRPVGLVWGAQHAEDEIHLVRLVLAWTDIGGIKCVPGKK